MTKSVLFFVFFSKLTRLETLRNVCGVFVSLFMYYTVYISQPVHYVGVIWT